MKEYQQRVVEEFKELDHKIYNLSKFLKTEDFKNLDMMNQILLERQQQVMLEYSSVLEQRIALFDFDGQPSIELQSKINGMIES